MTPGDIAGAAEATVVALAVSGEHRAFAELVRRRQGMVRGLMRRLCGDAALAEDLAQEAFVQAWRAASTGYRLLRPSGPGSGP
jgi:RNA polymerase sigma-70 factor (ECF subfamily)